MKKSSGNKILIVIASVLLALVIIVGTAVLVLYITNKDDTGAEQVAESESSEEPDTGDADDADAGDIAFEAETPEDDNSAGKQDTDEDFRQYLNDVLIPEFGVFKSPQKGAIHSDDYGATIDGEWFDPSGMFSASIYDFDRDGDDEMLVILNSEINRFDVPASSGSSAISLGIYEDDNGEIHLADSVMFGTIGALYKNEDGELRVYDGTNRNNDEDIEGIPLYGDAWQDSR